MKRIGTLIALFLVATIAVKAQDNYKHSLSGIKQVRIEVNTPVKVVVGSSNELVLAKYKGNDNDHDDNRTYHYENHEHESDSTSYAQRKKDKRKGMKAVYANGVDNTGFGMLIEKDGDNLRIRDLKSFTQRGRLLFTLPKNMDVHLDCGSLGSAKVEGFSSEIEVNTSVGNINLIGVTGPITAHSSTGEINVIFANVNQNSPISINSSTGDVDVSLPTNTKANLELRSTMGTVYTDFDLETPRKDGMKRIGATRKIETQLNSGGVKINLRSSTGDVYLRKAKN
jgi:hypothetical protein